MDGLVDYRIANVLRAKEAVREGAVSRPDQVEEFFVGDFHSYFSIRRVSLAGICSMYTYA